MIEFLLLVNNYTPYKRLKEQIIKKNSVQYCILSSTTMSSQTLPLIKLYKSFLTFPTLFVSF